MRRTNRSAVPSREEEEVDDDELSPLFVFALALVVAALLFAGEGGIKGAVVVAVPAVPAVVTEAGVIVFARILNVSVVVAAAPVAAETNVWEV